MQPPRILNRLALLLAPLCLLSLTACGTERVEFLKPAPERVAAVAYPVIPEASTPCAFDPAAMCLADEQTATVIADYDAALAEANRRLQWLRNWLAGLPD